MPPHGAVWYGNLRLAWAIPTFDGQTRSRAIPALAGIMFFYAARTIETEMGDGVPARRREVGLRAASGAHADSRVPSGAGTGS